MFVSDEAFVMLLGRSFNDLDGHLWEVFWMDPDALEQSPEAAASMMQPEQARSESGQARGV